MSTEVVFYALMIIALYFLPGIVAKVRNHRNSDSILLLNLLLGWTLLGWIVALVWAFTRQGGSAEGNASASSEGSIISTKTHVRCPDCRELVRWDARKCKHCGIALVPLERPPG